MSQHQWLTKKILLDFVFSSKSCLGFTLSCLWGSWLWCRRRWSKRRSCKRDRPIWRSDKTKINRQFLSAAEGQRPCNYSSCCSWIFRLVYALSTSTTVLPPFFKYFKFIHCCCCCSWIFHLLYALSTSTTVLPPICLNILNLSIYPSIHLAVFFLSIYQSTSSIP